MDEQSAFTLTPNKVGAPNLHLDNFLPASARLTCVFASALSTTRSRPAGCQEEQAQRRFELRRNLRVTYAEHDTGVSRQGGHVEVLFVRSRGRPPIGVNATSRA